MNPDEKHLRDYVDKEYFVSQLYYLGFNSNNIKLKNIKIRKYLACLLPNKKLTYSNISVIPMGLFGYNPNLKYNCNDSNDGVDGSDLPKTITISYYLEALRKDAENYCTILQKKSINCSLKKVDSVEELEKMKLNSSLELFFARVKSTIPLAEDIFSVFTINHPMNLFDTSKNSEFSIYYADEFSKLLTAPESNKKNIIDIYNNLNQFILNNYLLKPISYGSAEKFWIKPDIWLPDIGILGITRLNLAEVKRL